MIPRIALACLLAAVPLVAGPAVAAAQQEQEKPKVPKDSLLVNVTGCLKGRVVRAEDVRQPDTTSGMTITNRSFRLAGKKDVVPGRYNRFWFDNDRYGLTLGGGKINNPGRYLVLLPPINGAIIGATTIAIVTQPIIEAARSRS